MFDLARHLLEASNLTLKKVALNSGFDTAEQMRGAFQQRLGITPSQYRENFSTNSTAG
ncbi:helix-turn-helix domain-containing protein [bacterium]|nr:MAG: helix-turn-helix domain-containing protein [bacterium]